MRAAACSSRGHASQWAAAEELRGARLTHGCIGCRLTRHSAATSVTDLPSAITARTTLCRWSATLSSVMKGVSSVTRSRCQPSTEGLSTISRRPFVGHQPDPYTRLAGKTLWYSNYQTMRSRLDGLASSDLVTVAPLPCERGLTTLDSEPTSPLPDRRMQLVISGRAG
jgi:hypothetical protein